MSPRGKPNRPIPLRNNAMRMKSHSSAKKIRGGRTKIGAPPEPNTHDSTVDKPTAISTKQTANSTPIRRVKRARRRRQAYGPPRGGHGSLSGHQGGRGRRRHRDPGSGIRDPGSGIRDPGSGIRDPPRAGGSLIG